MYTWHSLASLGPDGCLLTYPLYSTSAVSIVSPCDSDAQLFSLGLLARQAAAAHVCRSAVVHHWFCDLTQTVIIGLRNWCVSASRFHRVWRLRRQREQPCEVGDWYRWFPTPCSFGGHSPTAAIFSVAREPSGPSGRPTIWTPPPIASLCGQVFRTPECPPPRRAWPPFFFLANQAPPEQQSGPLSPIRCGLRRSRGPTRTKCVGTVRAA